MKQLFATLQKQMLLLLLIVFVLLGSSFLVVLENTLGNSIQVLEQTYASENVARIQNAIDLEAAMLEAIAGDYAAWDDTYQFLLDNNQDYLDANIIDSALSNIDVDFIAFYNQKGQLVFGKGVGMSPSDFESNGKSLTQSLATLGFLTNSDPQFKTRGILRIDESAVLFGLRPIIKSDLTGPVRGHLLMARNLNQEVIDQISAKLKMKIALVPMDALTQNGAFDYSDLTPTPNSDFANEQGTVPFRLIYGEGDTMRAFSLLVDGLRNPVYGLRIDMTRDFSVALRKSKQTITVITLLLSLASTGLLAYFLDRQVLRRLAAIRMALGKIGMSLSKLGTDYRQPFALPKDPASDEIAYVVDAMNRMLEKIHATQSELELSKEKYRMFVENGRDIILSIDSEGVITYISPNCDEVMGLSATQVTGEAFESLLDEDWLAECGSPLSALHEDAPLKSFEFKGKAKDMPWRWYRLDLSLLKDELGAWQRIGIFYDIHQMKRAEQQLKASHDNLETLVKQRTRQLVESNHALENEILLRKRAQEDAERLAFFDPLTGLPNRTLLGNRMDQAIALAQRIQKPLGVLYMDLDGFKSVNDTMGHEQGDNLLKEISVRLTNTIRKSDTVARMGGDEFLVLVQNLEHVDHIHTLALKLLDAFKEPFKLNHYEIFISASIGASVYPVDGTTKEDLIKHADLAMYKAKDSGKNQYIACDDAMKAIVHEKMHLSNSLYRALERNELELYYQPQVCNQSYCITGVEALLRWHHPELGLIPPYQFIDLAEQTGLIIPIGQWVLKTACAQCKTWQDQGYTDIRMAVNLSVIQFQCPDIVQQIEAILTETQLEPQFLELEITESVAMRDKDYVIHVLNDFRAMGVQIAIDDFGTDYSSLAYLKLLPVNRIKIPMPFIQGIDVNQKDKAIAKSIIVLSHSMGMEVLAEGVETQQQAEFLKDWDCDDMQGYLFHKPMPAAAATQILAENATKHIDIPDNPYADFPDNSHPRCLKCRHHCPLYTEH